jgi:hypothetical protein
MQFAGYYLSRILQLKLRPMSALGVEEIKSAAAGTIELSRCMDLDSTLFHVSDRERKIFPAHRAIPNYSRVIATQGASLPERKQWACALDRPAN